MTETAGNATTDNPWIGEIDRAQKAKDMADWEKACEVIRKKYRYEASTTSKTRRYQMLWSNTEVMKGATYSKPPKGVVERRYRDKDDSARQATLMVERCINYTLDAEDYDGKLQQVRDDFILYARGQARVVYEPVMEAVDLPDDGLDGADVEGIDAEAAEIAGEASAEDAPQSGDEAAANDEAAPDEILKFERVKLKYLQRRDFVHSISRTWDEVTWCAFRSYLDADELTTRFGAKVAATIPLTSKSDVSESQSGSSGSNDGESKAEIWEIWHKTKNRVMWVAAGYPEIIEESEPYLKLSGFFPCPKPAYGTLTNDTLAPRPDFIFYQDQAEEIDALTARISSLQESLKVVGFYPAGPSGEGYPEIERAVTPGVENKMIAVRSWAAFADGAKGGVPIAWLPIEQVITVLEGCVKLRAQLIEDVNQIYGISDIMRGEGDAGETATAQGIKAQFGSLRIKSRQAEIARFSRDICRLVGEIICNHFQPETIMAMSNLPLPTDEQVLQQLQLQQQQMMMQQAIAAHQQQMQAVMAAQQPQQAPGGPQGPPPQMQPQAPQMMHQPLQTMPHPILAQPPMGMHP